MILLGDFVILGGPSWGWGTPWTAWWCCWRWTWTKLTDLVLVLDFLLFGLSFFWLLFLGSLTKTTFWSCSSSSIGEWPALLGVLSLGFQLGMVGFLCCWQLMVVYAGFRLLPLVLFSLLPLHLLHDLFGGGLPVLVGHLINGLPAHQSLLSALGSLQDDLSSSWGRVSCYNC